MLEEVRRGQLLAGYQVCVAMTWLCCLNVTVPTTDPFTELCSSFELHGGLLIVAVQPGRLPRRIADRRTLRALYGLSSHHAPLEAHQGHGSASICVLVANWQVDRTSTVFKIPTYQLARIEKALPSGRRPNTMAYSSCPSFADGSRTKRRPSRWKPVLTPMAPR